MTDIIVGRTIDWFNLVGCNVNPTTGWSDGTKRGVDQEQRDDESLATPWYVRWPLA